MAASDPEAMDDVVAVVVTYNSAAVIDGLLDSLPAAFGSATYHVVVVDNGSSDTTIDVLRSRDDCQVLLSSNRGYAAGINLGVCKSPPARHVLALNPDVRMAPRSIEWLVAAAQAPRVGIVVPLVRDARGEVYRSLRREPTLGRAMGLTRTGLSTFSEYVSAAECYRSAHSVDWALGAVMLAPREVHDVLGGWDESYFLYSEETDLCLRARDIGLMTWFEPAAECLHIGGQSGSGPELHVMQIVNRVRLYRRRHGIAASLAYLALATASELSWVARGSTRSRAAIRALLQPSRRPAQLRCGSGFLPT